MDTYQKKYLKYKAKYLELKKGGGDKLLTYAEILNKFNAFKIDVNNIDKKLYYKRLVNKEDKNNYINNFIDTENIEDFEDI